MFSLIITIISIALVAVLALATLYYGGDAFNKGTADAQAAKIVNQGQQLLGAAELYYADNRDWPANVQALVDGHYLKSKPVAYQGNGSVAEAWAAAAWEMPTAGQPVFVADVAASDACKAVNQRTMGEAVLLDKAYPNLVTQCYGATAFKAVVSKNTTTLAAVSNDGSTAVPGLLPATDISASAYGAAPEVDPTAPFLIKVTAQYSGGALHLNLRALGGQDLSPYVSGPALFQASAHKSDGTQCNLGPNWTDIYASPTQLTWPAWPDMVTVDPATAFGSDHSTLDLTMYSYNNANEVGDPSNNLDTRPLSLWDGAPCLETARVVVGELGDWFPYSYMASEGPESKSVCLAMTYNSVLGRHRNNGNVVPCP